MSKPKIRFKGCSEEWHFSSYKEIGTNFQYGLNAAATSFDGVNKYLRITDIEENLRYFSESQLTSPSADLSLCDSFLLHTGDIVFARTGASVGKSYIYNEYDGKVYFAGFLIRMIVKKGINPNFIFQNSLTTKFANHIRLVSQRSGQPGLNVNDLQNYNFYISPSIEEQNKIGEFLSSLDSRIKECIKKISSLNQFKSACLQSMFPQKGKSTPKVRFTGFDKEWKKYTFNEIFKKSIIKNDLSFGCDRIISVANMYFIPKSYVSDSEYLKTYNIMKIGDIAFEGNRSKKFSHGRFVENTIGDGIVSHVFQVFSPKIKDHDVYYWKYAINNENVMKDILGRCTKSSTMMTDLVIKDFLAETILVPSYEEQVLIGKFFVNLDKQISVQTQRFEKLKHIKAACLDQMFV